QTERESQLAEHLAKLQRDVQALEHERRLVARDRETLNESSAKLHARELELRGREETFRKRLDERIEERLRDARRQIDSVVDQLKGRTGALAAGANQRAARLVPTGAVGAARAEARAAVDAIGERLRSGAEAAEVATANARATENRAAVVGDRVLVGPFVANFNAAPPEQGGGGVTVVELKE